MSGANCNVFRDCENKVVFNIHLVMVWFCLDSRSASTLAFPQCVTHWSRDYVLYTNPKFPSRICLIAQNSLFTCGLLPQPQWCYQSLNWYACRGVRYKVMWWCFLSEAQKPHVNCGPHTSIVSSHDGLPRVITFSAVITLSIHHSSSNLAFVDKDMCISKFHRLFRSAQVL